MKKKVAIIALVSFVFLSVTLGGTYLFFKAKETVNPATTATETNTNPTLYTLEQQKKQLTRFDEVYTAAFTNKENITQYGTYVIPGLLATKTLALDTEEFAMSTTMTPQGVTVSENYLFISAYSHVEQYNSVIYVLDRTTHNYIKTVVLDGKPHAGGIAYDSQNQNILVSSKKDNIAEVVSISLGAIEAYDLEQTKAPIAYTQRFQLPNIKDASFITYHNRYLYVGLFTNDGKSMLEKYQIDNNGNILEGVQRSVTFAETRAEVQLDQTYQIMGEIQGVTFYDNKILLSRSNGAFSDSELLVFTDVGQDHIFLKDDAEKIIKFPERLEQIYSDDNALYTIFESASYAYRFLAFTRVDRVLQLDIPLLLKP